MKFIREIHVEKKEFPHSVLRHSTKFGIDREQHFLEDFPELLTLSLCFTNLNTYSAFDTMCSHSVSFKNHHNVTKTGSSHYVNTSMHFYTPVKTTGCVNKHVNSLALETTNLLTNI